MSHAEVDTLRKRVIQIENQLDDEEGEVVKADIRELKERVEGLEKRVHGHDRRITFLEGFAEGSSNRAERLEHRLERLR